MAADRDTRDPQDKQEDGQAASGGPITYGSHARQLFELGYEPLPITPGTKKPAPRRWSSVAIDGRLVDAWGRHYPGHGIGLRTGQLVGLDIDLLDPELAHRAMARAQDRFGHAPMRVGRWPKRVLIYRTLDPFPKLKLGQLEILAAGQQVVAFGTHPDTGMPYQWPLGETPLDVAFADLPPVDRPALEAFLAEASAFLPVPASGSRAKTRAGRGDGASFAPERDEQGRVVDGRDEWLSRIGFHAVHDAFDAGVALDPEVIGAQVWERFEQTTDLNRPRQNGGRHYCFEDAVRKVADKLRLHGEGRLPLRKLDAPEPEFEAPQDSAGSARGALATELEGFCGEVADWHAGARLLPPPSLAVRATVGLGKSRIAAEQVLDLQHRLRAAGLPSRVLVFVPTHALADEAVQNWAREGIQAVVLRGYEATDRATGEPMCRDVEAVRAAVASGEKVQSTVCANGDDRCVHFIGCAKQRNREAVAGADVVLAAYDALFSGLAFAEDDIGLIVVDEGCWQRAVADTRGIFIQDLATEPVRDMAGGHAGDKSVGAMADLVRLRGCLRMALANAADGPVTPAALLAHGLDTDALREAAALERRRLRDPELRPGLSVAERKAAFLQAKLNERVRKFTNLWTSLAALADGSVPSDGRVRLQAAAVKERREIVVRQVKKLHESLRNKPVLHLDATFRAELAGTILPSLAVTAIDADAPHQHVTLVPGSFGKGTLCHQEPGLAEAEARRRQNRLREVVDHVRWQARRVAPGRVLVITYQSIESAFTGIPGVETAHYNAVAGLDQYKDVSLIICVGRPLPRDTEVEALCGAFFGHVPDGRYMTGASGIRMRDGTARAVRIVRHADERAETVRAAICDDELIQAIGRGRGVNRTSADRLEVQVLADVALPLLHDRLTPWEALRPDMFQRMLLAGLAVDSPADAAALHPEMFTNDEQAKKQLAEVFKGNFPIRTTHREISLKSARYRRAGRGRSWQTCWWIDGGEGDARARLERVLGPLDGWRSS
jgi:hypothetical protein